MIGQTVSHYRITERLDAGGQGVVYKAEDLTLGRTVALKFLPPDSLASEESRVRLMREARTAAALMHPGICPVYEIAEADGRAFIAMAYIQGQSLRERLAGGPLPLADALDIICQVGEALAAAHGKGIVHRDVKAANVMLTPEGRAVLLDFGLAIMRDETLITQRGKFVGTLAYMSPEQYRGSPADARCDIWSLGVLLYRTLAGRLPFQADYPEAMAYAVMHQEPEPLTAATNDIPAGLDGVLAKAMAKDPARRYQRVDDMVADLTALAEDREAQPAGRGPSRSKLARLWRRWSYGTRAAAILGVAAILTVSCLLLWPQSSGVIDSIGILPAQNLSGDPAQDIWADGVTEQLSTRLGTIGSLKVISNQTMKQFKGSSDPLPQIGQKVGVTGLVELAVLVADGEIQITAKLYAARQDRMVWSDTYRRPVKDVLNVQGSIANAIASKIEVALTPEEQAQLTRSREVDPAVYKAVLLGWNAVHKLSQASLSEAAGQFQRAIDLDPTYAEAYAGLSSAHACRALAGYGSPQEEFPLARAAAQRSLELDADLAAGHLALAEVLMEYDWDWAGAEREYRRALALDSSNADAHTYFASFLIAMGRDDEGLTAARQAVDIDPLNGLANLNLAWCLILSRRFDEAIDVLHTTQRRFPEIGFWAHNHLAWCYMMKGMGTQACAEGTEALRLVDNDEQVVMSTCARVYGLFGRKDEALVIIGRMEGLAKQQYVDPYCLAFAYDGLGDTDQAVDLLEHGFTGKSPSMYTINIELWTDALKADPRFQDIVRRLKFPETSSRH